MEIVKERNFAKLIGKFTGIEHVGEIVNVMIFEDERHGSMTIGVLQSEDVELHVPYQIIVSLHGKVRKYADGRTFTSNFLNLVSYEKVETKYSENEVTSLERGK